MLEFDFHIENDIFAPNVHIYITRRKDGVRQIGKIQWQDFNECEATVQTIEPTLKIPKEDRDQGHRHGQTVGKRFMERMLVELRGYLGLGEDPKVDGLEATLKAQKGHLDDMRKLVFEKLIFKNEVGGGANAKV